MHLFCWVFYLTQRHVWNVQIEHKLIIMYDSEHLVYNISYWPWGTVSIIILFYSVHGHSFSRRFVISWNKNIRKLYISEAFVQMSNEKCPSKRHRSNITLNAFNSTKCVFEGRVSHTKIEYIDHICLTITWGNALRRIIFFLWLLWQ